MKKIITLTYLFLISHVAVAQLDTVYFNLDQIAGQAGESVCIPLTAKNFTDIISVQLGFEWDETELRLDTILPGVLSFPNAVSYSILQSDRARLSWSDIVGVTANEEEPLIELCFTVLTDITTLLNVNVTDFPGFQIEVVKGPDLIQVVVADDGTIFSPPSNSEDCSSPPTCLESLQVTYPGDTVKIWKRDVIDGSLEDFAKCNNVSPSEVVLINLSSQEPIIGDYIDLYCGNLQETIHLGLAIRTSGTEQYWVSCIVPIYVSDIPAGGDCLTGTIYPSDPIICKDVNTSTTTSELSLNHESFLNLSSTPGIEYNYFSLDNIWFYNQIEAEKPYYLDCGDFNQTLILNTGLIIAPPEGPPGIRQIVIPDFCSHEINIVAAEEVCDVQIGDNETEVRIANLPEDQVVNAYINGNELRRISKGQYILRLTDLIENENKISVDQLQGVPPGASTLDLVLMMKTLRNEETFSSLQVIAADIDRSGSLTTKDILDLRYLILGITTNLENGFLFLAKPEDQLPALDVLQFENTYKDFVFDRSEVVASKGIDIELGHLGDVNNTKSTKSKSPLALKYKDIFIEKGIETIVTLQLENDNKNIVGLQSSFKTEDLTINNLTAPDNPAALLNHSLAHEFRFSYIDIDQKGSIELELHITSHKSGLLSQLLRLGHYKEEAVNLKYETFELELSPLENQSIDFLVYPNPTTDYLIAEIPNEYQGGTASITDILGRNIWERSINDATMVITSQDLQKKGMYIIHIEHNDQRISRKFYVNR